MTYRTVRDGSRWADESDGEEDHTEIDGGLHGVLPILDDGLVSKIQ